MPKCLLVYREFLLKKSNEEENFDEKKMTLVKNAMKRSSVCEHLANNLNCLKNFSTDMFRPIAQARSSFHLSVLEAIIISQNKPEICKQREFTYQTLLF